ncbi:glycosyltransferase, partial [Staphylococcus aureus]|uniref:glycosyltransferase n=1 Tax=Staphylococcus aureus TaxID=1280 RepID=UPI0023B1964C
GWFTHFESGTPGKVEVWHQADRSFDLRLVTSPVYESILNGRVTRVTPGIDLDHFAPTKGAKRGSRLGLSGIGSNRKGLELAHALIPYDLAVVAGRGWGLPETWVEYADMPAWYSQIDTYVCTATEEGIPAPVLEAMACGCKAVLPYGVGICDLLAGSPGVFMYQKGDPVSLRQAVDEAIAAKVSRVDIRDAVQGYGIASWVESNRTAVEELLDAPGSD